MRRVGFVALVVFLGLAAPIAVAAFGVAKAVGQVYPAGSRSNAQVPKPAYDAGKPTAVIVLGMDGTNVADSLVPYEVLAESKAFNVYLVASERKPVTLTGGLDVLPELTFAELDDLLPATPDVIVVPQLHGDTVAVVDWLKRQRNAGRPLFVSVCVGAEALAQAGLLDGRPATSHWLGMIGLRRDYPGVGWRDGVRYVEDGDVITTAGVLSGADGALRVIERFAGQTTAARVAQTVQWSGYTAGKAGAIEALRLRPADAVALLSAAYRWERGTMGVLLTDGVGEIELASAFRPYTELSYLARPLALSFDGQPIRSRHGLTFVPRADLTTDSAKGLDRLVVPGADAAGRLATASLPGGLTPTFLHTGPGFAFDGALRDIARTEDTATARWVGRSLQYPSDSLSLNGSAWPWGLTLRPLLIAALAVGLVFGARFLWRRKRADRANE